MEHLKRIRVERFLVKESFTLSQIEKIRDEGRLCEIILPVEEMFDGPKAFAGEASDRLVRNGNPVKSEDFSRILLPEGEGGRTGRTSPWGIGPCLHKRRRISGGLRV